MQFFPLVASVAAGPGSGGGQGQSRRHELEKGVNECEQHEPAQEKQGVPSRPGIPEPHVSLPPDKEKAHKKDRAAHEVLVEVLKHFTPRCEMGMTHEKMNRRFLPNRGGWKLKMNLCSKR